MIGLMGTKMGMKMWTQPEQPVDKHMLYTRRRTTPMQDVSRNGVICGHKNEAGGAKQPQFPQSTALITVIRSIYVHPHIEITTLRQREHGAFI